MACLSGFSIINKKRQILALLISLGLTFSIIAFSTNMADAEGCRSRGGGFLFGSTDIFWGDPPPVPFPSQSTGINMYPPRTYSDIKSGPVTSTPGSWIINSNFGSYQWYFDWPHDLFDGRYKFKVTKIDGRDWNSYLSTNVLIVTGAGTAPLDLGSVWCEREGVNWIGVWTREGMTNNFKARWNWVGAGLVSFFKAH